MRLCFVGLLFASLLMSMQLTAEESGNKLGTELDPFAWHYDITYKTGKKTYVGTGSYVLAKIAKSSDKKNKRKKKKRKKNRYPENAEYTFTASIETSNKVFRSTDTLWLLADKTHHVVPLQRRQKITILGFTRSKEIPLTPIPQGSYYDDLSIVLFLQEQVRQYANKQSKTDVWEVWLADRDKGETYRLVADESITTPLGVIDCYVLIKEERSSKRKFKVWLAKDKLYIAKLEQTNGKEKTLMRINNIEL